MADPLIAVVRVEYTGACRYTGYVPRSIRLFLACGHESVRKESQGVPERARCRECGRAVHPKRGEK